MEISDEAKDLIEKINNYSGNSIKNNKEFSIIIESAFKSKNHERFYDLIFKAKYIKGLKNVLSNRIVIGDDFMEKIFKEFNDNIQLFISLLKETIAEEDESDKKLFNEKYFEMNQESMLNIMNLTEDLSICKEYFNNNPEEILNQRSGI